MTSEMFNVYLTILSKQMCDETAWLNNFTLVGSHCIVWIDDEAILHLDPFCKRDHVA